MSSVTWRKVKIKDIAEINPDSISPKTPKDTLINYIDLESVKKGKVLAVKEMKLSEAPSRAKRIVKKGDVLFSTVRPYQKNFTIIENEQDNLIASTGFALLRAKENSDSRFIYQTLYSDIFMNQIIAEMKGSNYPAVNASDVEKVEILLPPLEEQQKIASILSTVDEQIDQTEQLIVKTKELKKGLMQQLLTKGIGHTEFKQSELGEIPKEWELSSLGNLFVISSGLTPLRANQKYFDEGQIPWVKTLDLNNKYIVKTQECITELALNETSIKLIPKNTVLLAMYGGFNQIGRTGLLQMNATTNQAISALLPKNKTNIDSNFLQMYLIANVNRWKNFAASSRKDPNITKSDVESFSILIPPLTEQKKISLILSSVDEQIEGYEKEKEKYEELKKGLMQQLLTGKVRVKVD